MPEDSANEAIDKDEFNPQDFTLQQLTGSYQKVSFLMKSLRRTKDKAKRKLTLEKIKKYSNVLLPAMAKKWAERGERDLAAQIEKMKAKVNDTEKIQNPHDAVILAYLEEEYKNLTLPPNETP